MRNRKRSVCGRQNFGGRGTNSSRPPSALRLPPFFLASIPHSTGNTSADGRAPPDRPRPAASANRPSSHGRNDNQPRRRGRQRSGPLPRAIRPKDSRRAVLVPDSSADVAAISRPASGRPHFAAHGSPPTAGPTPDRRARPSRWPPSPPAARLRQDMLQDRKGEKVETWFFSCQFSAEIQFHHFLCELRVLRGLSLSSFFSLLCVLSVLCGAIVCFLLSPRYFFSSFSSFFACAKSASALSFSPRCS